MTITIGTILGPYRILEQIGLGGMATVYKAYQTDVDRMVAVKILPEHYARDPRFVERFKQEARVIARLEHRNIVPIYDFGEQAGLTYLVMRYLQAGTLKDILAQGALSLADVARILADVAAALDYAHSQGIIHRDVKPSNILVDKQGSAYLTDFGIAKVLESTHELTGSALLGTPAYMAPEQTQGKPVTPQSDVYSLGVMLYEMVTGRQPFEAETPMAVALMHIHEPLPKPRNIKPELSEALELVILKALAKDPRERFRSAGELARAFAAVALASQTTLPSGSVRLTKLAGEAAAGKSSEEVTNDLRQELRRRQQSETARQWLRRMPLLVGTLLAIALIGAVIWLGFQFFNTQNAVQVTATVLALNRQAATLTAGAATHTPSATARPTDNPGFTSTVDVTQTQLAAATRTQVAAFIALQQTQAASETLLALAPTAGPTATPKPSPTNIPTTYIDLYAGKLYFTKVVKAGRIAFSVSPCWASEADAAAATPLDPTFTINGAPVALAELPSHEFSQSPNGVGWCLKWPSVAYFVATLSAGSYDLQWQWGALSGYGTLTVGAP